MFFLQVAFGFGLLRFLCLHPLAALSPRSTDSKLALSTTLRSSTCPVRMVNDAPFTGRFISNTSRAALVRSNSQPRIVNGDPASVNLAPYMVAISLTLADGSSGICTGTLIDKEWVITAAHCVEAEGVNTEFSIGTRALTSFYPYAPDKTIWHDNYNFEDGRKFDIAVSRLSSPAPEGAKFMKVNVNTKIPEAGSYVRALGYGTIGNDIPNPGDLLRQVDVPVTTDSDCENAYASPGIDSDAQLCAGYSGGKCDSCQGDSGGPIIQYDDAGEPVLVGIVSFGRGCAEADYPGVYVRTAAFQNWLDAQQVVYVKATETAPIFRKFTLSTAAIAGIVIAGLVLVVLLSGLAVFFVRKRKGGADTDDEVQTVPVSTTPGAADTTSQPPPSWVPQVPIPQYQVPGDQDIPAPTGTPQVPVMPYYPSPNPNLQGTSQSASLHPSPSAPGSHASGPYTPPMGGPNSFGQEWTAGYQDAYRNPQVGTYDFVPQPGTPSFGPSHPAATPFAPPASPQPYQGGPPDNGPPSPQT